MVTPRITAAPPKVVQVTRGDVVKLRVDYKANRDLVQQVKWVIRSQSMVCRDATCTLRTSGIRPGSHAVYVVVFDDSGSDSLKFDLQVRELAKGEKARQVTVTPEAVSDDRRIDDGDGADTAQFFMRHVMIPVQGRAYSHSRSEVRVVGQGGEAIGKTDTLRTGTPGLLRISLPGADESWLLDGSLLRLRGRAGSRGTARLERGTIRSRALNNVDPGWDLAAGGYVFRGNGQRDIVVKRLPGDEILVAVLRGDVRVHTETTVKGQADEEAFFRITPGSMIRLRTITGATGQDPSRPVIAGTPGEQEIIAQIIRLTTPQYLAKRENADATRSAFIRNRKPVSLDDAAKMARASLASGDAWLAIEPLLFRLDEAAKQPAASYLVGRSYVEMLLLREGEEWLTKSLELSDQGTSANDARIMLGNLNYKRKAWSAAALYFTAANLDAWISDPKLGGERSFIAGKSCALGEKRSCARNLLPRAAREGSSPSARDEARLLLKKLDLLPGHTRQAGIRIGYNSNIFGLTNPGDDTMLPEGVKSNQTGSWNAFVGIESRSMASDETLTDDQNRLGLEFKADISRSGYAKDDVTDYAISTYQGQLGLFYTLAAKPEPDAPSSAREPLMDFVLNGYLMMGGVGRQRVHDEAGAGVRFRLPWLLGLDLEYRKGRAVDPQPDLEHRIDYLTGEPSASADDTGAISRLHMRFVPIGPNSLTGEDRGASHFVIEAGTINVQRESFPDGTGPLRLLQPRLHASRKVLDQAVTTFTLGTDIITRDITATAANSLGLPQRQTKSLVGVNFSVDVSQFVTIDLDARHYISTSSGSSTGSFKRTVATLGTIWDF